MSTLQGKTLFISGASRGIGKHIALRAARDGANIVVAAKTSEPHPKLEGTIYTAAAEIEAAGGKALPLMVDVRDEDQVTAAVEQAVKHFGGLDILINNASAINLTGTLQTEMKRFDLMNQVNYRGTYMVSQKCVPHLKNAANPHVLTLSPPLNMNPNWFARHVAYTISKYNMSLCTLGMAEEFRRDGIAFNSLWPKTAIATAAIEFQMGGDQLMRLSRKPDIMSDAAYAILIRDSKKCTGQFFIDEDVLREEGFTDFSGYRISAELEDSQLLPDLFL